MQRYRDAVVPARHGSDDGDDGVVCVRPACDGDERFVVDALTTTLHHYYGGDHAAHARRLLRTHLRGGEDTRGSLSVRQHLLLLWRGARRLGLVNLVFKRQQTCKLSPLIVFAPGEDPAGLGSVLLDAAERVSHDCGMRQLYCTVAERNTEALAFFVQHGFVECGSSKGQYKEGEIEVALSKSLTIMEERSTPDSIISVAPLGEHDWPEVRDLFAAQLRSKVLGFDLTWLAAMPYPPQDGELPEEERRPRWIYVATDRAGCRRAAAVIAPKKGDALKAMPVVARDLPSFEAMVVDLPSLLVGKGRKVYLHAWPSTDEVRVLQDAGWTLEALLPGAYHPSVTTQQWAFPLTGGGYVRNLRIRREYFRQIVRGTKTLEVRVGYDHLRRIRPGDSIRLLAGSRKALCRVRDVRRYRTFAEMLRHEDPNRIIPGDNAEQALKRLRDIYPPNKEALGVLVLELDDIVVQREDADTLIP